MFQGMARGKVGDVVFSRLNGEQISRVRNRHPKNPRTNAQLYQRAIMATIMQAYSAGREIFDHSFQGKSVGAENMNTFLSRNIKMLRALIASEIANLTPLADQKGRVVGPGSIYPVPVEGLILSEGELSNNVVTIGEATASQPSQLKMALLPSAATYATWAEWAQAVGVRVGDIFTVVAYINEGEPVFEIDGITDVKATQYRTLFGFVRMIVKEGTAGEIAGTTTLGDLFDIEIDGDVFQNNIGTKTLQDVSAIALNQIGNFGLGGVAGVIRSRDDEDVRSSAQTVAVNTDRNYGIASSYALQAWKQGTGSLGQSDLILEGGDF